MVSGKMLVDMTTDIAAAIPEDEKRSFVLAGICVASNTFINESQTNRIGGLLRMTKVGQMFMKEFEDLENQLAESRAEVSLRDAQLAESKSQLAESRAEISLRDAQLEESNLNCQKLQKTLDTLINNLLHDGISLERIRSGDQAVSFRLILREPPVNKKPEYRQQISASGTPTIFVDLYYSNTLCDGTASQNNYLTSYSCLSLRFLITGSCASW